MRLQVKSFLGTERELYCCHGRDAQLEMTNRSQAVAPDNISEIDLFSATVQSALL